TCHSCRRSGVRLVLRVPAVLHDELCERGRDDADRENERLLAPKRSPGTSDHFVEYGHISRKSNEGTRRWTSRDAQLAAEPVSADREADDRRPEMHLAVSRRRGRASTRMAAA